VIQVTSEKLLAGAFSIRANGTAGADSLDVSMLAIGMTEGGIYREISFLRLV